MVNFNDGTTKIVIAFKKKTFKVWFDDFCNTDQSWYYDEVCPAKENGWHQKIPF